MFFKGFCAHARSENLAASKMRKPCPGLYEYSLFTAYFYITQFYFFVCFLIAPEVSISSETGPNADAGAGRNLYQEDIRMVRHVREPDSRRIIATDHTGEREDRENFQEYFRGMQ